MTENKFLTLIQSRRFWVVIFSLIIIVVKYFVPTFALDYSQLTGLIIATVSYVIGVTKDPSTGNLNKWSYMLTSRKFWSYVISMAIVVLSALHASLPFNITPETLITTITLISSYGLAVAFDQPLPEEPATIPAADSTQAG